jgi:hypothetical protein
VEVGLDAVSPFFDVEKYSRASSPPLYVLQENVRPSDACESKTDRLIRDQRPVSVRNPFGSN